MLAADGRTGKSPVPASVAEPFHSRLPSPVPRLQSVQYRQDTVSAPGGAVRSQCCAIFRMKRLW